MGAEAPVSEGVQCRDVRETHVRRCLGLDVVQSSRGLLKSSEKSIGIQIQPGAFPISRECRHRSWSRKDVGITNHDHGRSCRLGDLAESLRQRRDEVGLTGRESSNEAIEHGDALWRADEPTIAQDGFEPDLGVVATRRDRDERWRPIVAT